MALGVTVRTRDAPAMVVVTMTVVATTTMTKDAVVLGTAFHHACGVNEEWSMMGKRDTEDDGSHDRR